MTNTSRFLAVAMTAFAGAASAGPLDKSRVPADSAWVVHVDIEAGLGSSLGRFAVEHAADPADLEGLKAQFGVDPLTDIKDLTVFGIGTDGEDAVAVITTTPAIEDALSRLQDQGHQHSVVNEGGYELLSWSENEQVQYALIRPMGDGLRLLYLSKDKSRLARAADVSAGLAASLKGKTASVLSDGPRPGAVLFIASDVIPSHGRADQASMVLGKARSLRFEAGESGPDLYADLTLTTSSSEDASNVVKVLEGLRAMGQMFCQGNPDLAPIAGLAEAVRLSADESAVSIAIRYPAADAIDALRAAERGDGDDEADEDEAEADDPV